MWMLALLLLSLPHKLVLRTYCQSDNRKCYTKGGRT